MKDRIYLQHLWSFLSQHMAIIANNIKDEAQKTFDKETKENPIHVGMGSTSTLTQSNHINNRILMLDKRKKPCKKPIRGLTELTGDSMIFAKLHMWFTWILRMSACQISEEFIHGPLSEDVQVGIY